jgi:hypothetical protein
LLSDNLATLAPIALEIALASCGTIIQTLLKLRSYIQEHCVKEFALALIGSSHRSLDCMYTSTINLVDHDNHTRFEPPDMDKLLIHCHLIRNLFLTRPQIHFQEYNAKPDPQSAAASSP